ERRLFLLRSCRRPAAHRLAGRVLPQRASHVVCLAESLLGGGRGFVCAAGGVWCDLRLEITVTERYEKHEHYVLIIGAGGAGLRAAIAALAQGATVGVVCKSLLGKAHTVMAEGGIAAAMANVDRSDDWRTHFRDTMRGGKFLNNWRMAQI